MHTLTYTSNLASLTEIGRWTSKDFADGNGSVRCTADNAGKVRTRFTGTSFAVVYVASSTAEIEYRVDSGAWTRVAASGTVQMASALVAGTHTVEIWTAGTYYPDRWDGSKGPRPKSIIVDDGATLSAWPTGAAERWLVIGDSITSEAVYNANTSVAGSEGRRCWGSQLGALCNADVWNTGHGGTGATSGFSSTPASPDAYPYIISGAPHTDPVFDRVFIHLGHNEAGAVSATFKAAMSTLIGLIRADSPAAVIYLMEPLTPWAPSRATDIRAVAISESCTLVGSEAWTISYTYANHPNLAGHTQMAALLAEIVPTASPASALKDKDGNLISMYYFDGSLINTITI